MIASFGEPGKQEICQVLQTSTLAVVYVSKGIRVRELKMFLSRIWVFAVLLVSVSYLLQLIVVLNRRQTVNCFLNMTTPPVFDVIIASFGFLVFNDKLQKKTVLEPQNNHVVRR